MLLTLLWLAVEFMVGLHEEPLIKYHPYITLLAFIIPVVVTRMAIQEKTESLDGKITFKQAFAAGFLVAFFAAVLAIPTQFIFHKLVNPDFFSSMIDYSMKRAEEIKIDPGKARQEAEMYFNLTSYIVQSGLATLVVGTIVAAIMAMRMRTVK